MANRKKPVTTPLHLLQQMSQSLLEHLEQACSEALVDAEKLLAKLEKQRSKAQDKLHKASVRLEDAAAAGKAKAQAKARESIAELEELLEILKQRQADTREHIVRLKADAEQSLQLAQGIGKVKESVARLLADREAGEAPPAKAHAPRRTRPAAAAPGQAKAPTRNRRSSAKPASAAEAPSAPAVEAPAAAKPARKRSSPTAKPTAPRNPQTKSQAKPAPIDETPAQD